MLTEEEEGGMSPPEVDWDECSADSLRTWFFFRPSISTGTTVQERESRGEQRESQFVLQFEVEEE